MEGSRKGASKKDRASVRGRSCVSKSSLFELFQSIILRLCDTSHDKSAQGVRLFGMDKDGKKLVGRYIDVKNLNTSYRQQQQSLLDRFPEWKSGRYSDRPYDYLDDF